MCIYVYIYMCVCVYILNWAVFFLISYTASDCVTLNF